MNRNRAWPGLLLFLLAALLWYSVHLAANRIYQVDECQNLYMAKVQATGRTSEYFTNASLFLLGPLSWITQKNAPSADFFHAGRWLFLGVFWFNLILLSAIASERLFSFRGLVALAGAATLAPLWDYGFEIRHDNVILAGLLLTWWAVRLKPRGTPSYLLAGAIAVVLLFIAVKTVIYVVPLSFAILAFPPPAHKKSRWHLGLAWIGGAALALVLVRLSYGSGPAWDNYLSVFRKVTQNSADAGVVTRFWPWNTLGRLLSQSPLLLALSAAACFVAVRDLVRRRFAALTWSGILPEMLLLVGALAAVIVNPTPFPYNLVNVVPFACILVFRYLWRLWQEVGPRPSLLPLAAAVLVCVHFAPFVIATQRHLRWPNTRQQELMQLAEALTDAQKDPVYDAIGMVPSRPSIHFQWYLHSLNIRQLVTPVRDMLAARPAAVLIPSYRTDWLPKADRKFIQQRYVPLADDFWVLGVSLPPGGGAFEIVHPGRYSVISVPAREPSGAGRDGRPNPICAQGRQVITGTLDGVAVSNRPVELTAGRHRIDATDDGRPTIVWVGPRLDQVPNPGAASHLRLFVNWY